MKNDNYELIPTQSFIINVIQQMAHVSEKDREIYQACFREKLYKKGEIFLQEGQICKHLGVVESGLMRFYVNQDDGERTFAFVAERELLCNYKSFISQSPSLATIQALEDTIVHTASFENFKYFYEHTQSADRIGRLVLGRVFVKLQDELTSFYTDTPEQRYQKFMEEYPNLQQRISQYHIASFVGVKPPSLSRIRKRIFAGR